MDEELGGEQNLCKLPHPTVTLTLTRTANRNRTVRHLLYESVSLSSHKRAPYPRSDHLLLQFAGRGFVALQLGSPQHQCIHNKFPNLHLQGSVFFNTALVVAFLQFLF